MQRHLSEPGPVNRGGRTVNGKPVASAARLIGRFIQRSPGTKWTGAYASSLGWKVITQSSIDPGMFACSYRQQVVCAAGNLGSDRSIAGASCKRVMDVLVALLALIALSPLMAAIAALVKVTMGGPVIFAQERVGRNGRPFRCYKFRTMVNGADEKLERHLASDPGAAQEWEQRRKLAQDPRVTALGKLLRISSLDELPQLFNVLRGNMSCVGPRPVVAAELHRYYGQHIGEYLKVQPGLTGLWQVSGRNRLSYAHRVALDRLYVQNWSMFLDIAILIKTLPAVLNFDQTA